MNNPTTPQGEPISLPEPAYGFYRFAKPEDMEFAEWAPASVSFIQNRLKQNDEVRAIHDLRYGKVYEAKWLYDADAIGAAILADRAHRAASPDVAKMMEEAKLEADAIRGDFESCDKLNAIIDALGAAATQARAAVGAEQGQAVTDALDDLMLELRTLAHCAPNQAEQHATRCKYWLENLRAALSAQTPGEGWILTSPDGRQWRGDSALQCVAAEQRERIPATVALERIYAAADEQELADRSAIAAELEGHAISASACPPDSMVVPQYSIRRLLASLPKPPATPGEAQS